MSHLIFFIYVFLCATAFAKVEINIEGKYGWAEKLPTWRKEINLPLIRNHVVTGYHVFMFVVFLPLILHLPFLFMPWSLNIETKIIAFYLFMSIFEDFMWFVLNPDYGIKGFNPVQAKWHRKWFLHLPIEFWIMLPIATLLYII